jgi:hypothetical protein
MVNFVWGLEHKFFARLHELHKLLLLYNPIDTVRSPTRVTKILTLVDVIITNKDNRAKLAMVVDFGYSDHKAQILHLDVNTLIREHKKVKTRQFTERSLDKFKRVLNKEPWQEVFKSLEVNATLQVNRYFLLLF